VLRPHDRCGKRDDRDHRGVRQVDGVLATAHALANAFADLGLPLEA
jgi:hypothetical protein